MFSFVIQQCPLKVLNMITKGALRSSADRPRTSPNVPGNCKEQDLSVFKS